MKGEEEGISLILICLTLEYEETTHCRVWKNETKHNKMKY